MCVSELRAELERARHAGQDFDQAWAVAVAQAVRGRGQDARDWLVALTATRHAWCRAYHLEPATAGDHAVATVYDLADLVGEPYHGSCERCGQALPAAGYRGRRILYCSARCRRDAYEARRQRPHAIAA